MFQKNALLLGAFGLALAGCGGGGGGGTSFASLSSSLSSLNSSTGGFGLTPEASMATGSATYAGVANIGFGTGSGTRDAALGALTVNVDFTADTLSGSINNFSYFDQTSASGSMTISSGALTGTNDTGIGNGLTADASGTVGGNALNMDVTGHFAGTGAEAIYLYFDGKSDSSLGVGVGIK